MKGMRWHYSRYLLWWCGVWLLTTVPTQLPECYERSKVYAPGDHLSVFSELMQFAGSRALVEVFFGLIWGSLSWLLQWGASAAVGQFRVPSLFQRGALTGLWFHLAPIVLLVCVEAMVLGVPLGYMNTNLANFTLGPDDSPLVTISDPSIRIESAGIMLAFPLACLFAGYFAIGRRLPHSALAPMSQNNVWPPAPRPSLQGINIDDNPGSA